MFWLSESLSVCIYQCCERRWEAPGEALPGASPPFFFDNSKKKKKKNRTSFEERREVEEEGDASVEEKVV